MIPFEATLQTIHGRTVRQFRFDPPYQILETLLSVEVRRSRRLLVAVDAVLSGQTPGTALTGNVLTLHIGQKQTVIMDTLAADGVGDACVVTTVELAELLRHWHNAEQQI